MLIERDAELAALRDAVGRAASGAGSTTLVLGPPGIGKSALLDELATGAGAVRVLRACGGELEQEFPYGVVRQLFENVVRSAEPAWRDELLGGPARPANALLGGAPGGPAGDAAALEHAFYWLATTLAEQAPLVLVVDDAHWADVPSLRWLVYLGRRVAAHPIALVVAARPVADPPGLLLGRLAADAVTLEPSPMSVAGVGRFLERAGSPGDEAFRAACHGASGGNPFLVQELVAAVVAEGMAPVAANAGRLDTLDAQNVARTVLLRMSGLSPAATPVARALAVLGDHGRPDLVAHLAGTDVAGALRAIDELRAAHVVAPGDTSGFAHSIVHAAVYGDIPPSLRSHLHGTAARRLADTGAPPDQVAAHLLLTEPAGDPWVVDALVSAAHDGLAASTPETAAVHLDRALREGAARTDRGRLLLQLGAARYQTVAADAVDPLREALTLTAGLQARAAVGRALASALITENRYDECWVLVDRLVAELREDADAATDVELFAAGALYTQLDSARRHLPRVAAWRPDAGGASARDRRMLAAQAWVLLCRPAEAGAVAAAARAALSTGTLVTDDVYGVSTEMAVWGLAGAGCHDEAVAALDVAIGSRRTAGQLLRAATLMVLRAELHRRSGRLQLALEDARFAADVIAPEQVFAPQSASVLAMILLDQGAVEQARDVLPGRDDPIPDGGLHDVVHLARGRLRIAEGDVAGGIQDVLDYGTVCEALGRRHPGHFPWRSIAASALVGVGRRDEAAALATDELHLADATGVPSVRGRALAALAAAQRGPRAVDTATRAAQLLDGSPLVLDTAEACFVLGRALRLAGRREDAREPLRRALDTATAVGARPLATRVRDELLAAGARPRRAALRGIDALTPSELRVASLAARGMTNRELAHTLYVTPKTIEAHLAAAYRKLGIAGKGDLAGVMATG